MVFWLTIAGANYPSSLLSDGLFWIQERLSELFAALHAPEWLTVRWYSASTASSPG